MTNNIAYICDGLVPECSGTIGCFKYPGTALDEPDICRHTTDQKHAVYGACEHPEDYVPSRFVYIPEEESSQLRYFEEHHEVCE